MNNEYTFTISSATKRFYNNGFGIYMCVVLDDIPHKKSETITLVGNLQELEYGLEYEVTAELVEDKRFGYQYKTTTGAMAKKPTSKDEQKRFLMSITTKLQADTILEHYPNIVDDVVNNNFDIDTNKTKGIGTIVWSRIKKKILDNFCISELLAMLTPIGITYAQIQKMLNHEPNPIKLKDVLINDPYSLTSVHGFGFKKVDGFALKLDPTKRESKERAKAFIIYFLTEKGNGEGHTWVNAKELIVQCKKNIPKAMKEALNIIKNNKDDKEDNFLIIEGLKIGLKRFYNKEVSCLRMIKEINDMPSVGIAQELIDSSILEANKEQGFELTSEQVDAVNRIVRSHFSILEAKAGCGKSVSSRAVLKTFYNKGFNIGCCAFTARASKMLTESTGFESTTIHRMLIAQEGGGFAHNRDNRLPYDVVLLDEGGMVNVPLLHALVSALKKDVIFIMVGDAGQLKPISYGDMFSDIVDRPNDFNIVSLKNVMRQAKDSGITEDANKIREGICPIDEIKPTIVNGKLKDNLYIFREDKEILNAFAIKTYLKIADDCGNLDDVVIMTPTRQKGVNSSDEISKQIQDKLLGHETRFINKMGVKYKLGAKVMHIKNDSNKDIYNGDIGYITKIVSNSDGTKSCIVDYGKQIGVREYSQADMKDLQLAYAMTVHKLQGAGIKNTIIVLDNTHRMMLNTSLLYTALTRSKKKNILLSTPRALEWGLRIEDCTRDTWAKTYDLSYKGGQN